jgi:hypothetical protein
MTRIRLMIPTLLLFGVALMLVLAGCGKGGGY